MAGTRLGVSAAVISATLLLHTSSLGIHGGLAIQGAGVAEALSRDNPWELRAWIRACFDAGLLLLALLVLMVQGRPERDGAGTDVTSTSRSLVGCRFSPQPVFFRSSFLM